MDHIKIRIGDNFDGLYSKIEKTIENMFRSMNPIFSLSECTWKPQMDIYEIPEEIIIIAEIAGVNKENLEVEISSKAVKIYGYRIELPHVKNTKYRLAEIQYGKFERILFLPASIDTDKVTASYLNGFLQIRLAKLPHADTRKVRIEE